MNLCRIARLLVAVCFVLPTVALCEPTALFQRIEWNSRPSSPPPPDALETYVSDLDVQGVAAMPAQVTVRIPRPKGAVDVTIDMESMDRREGFVQRDDDACDRGDSAGCELIPRPNLPDSGFSYRWSGRGQGYDLRLSIHHGHAVGILVGAAGRFAIAWGEVKELRMEYFPDNDPVEILEQTATPVALKPAGAGAVMTSAQAANATLLAIPPKSSSSARSTMAGKQIDMLVLFTEQGRIAAGGNSAVCSDTTGIVNVIQQGVGDIDDAFARSEIDAQVGAVTIGKLAGWEPVPYAGGASFSEAIQSRGEIQASPSIRLLRNAVGADVVVVVSASHTTLGPCGIAFVQRRQCATQGIPASPCTGSAFADYAYYISTVQCSTSADVFTHELGHVMGAEHERGANAPSDSTASHNFAFGYYNSTTFQTVMSQRFSTSAPPRLLQFSSSSVLSGGLPTGSLFIDNALAINNLAAGVEAFRGRPVSIFVDGFDSVSNCPAINYP